MAGLITRGSVPKLQWPGVKTIWGLAYKEYADGAEYKEIYDIEKSDKAYEEMVSLTSLGLVPIKEEGDAVSYDTMKQGFVSRFTNLTYALGYQITQEEIEDDQYTQGFKTAANRTKALAFSFHQTIETVGANILNRAFNASYIGGDGVELCSLLHPIEGGTMANTLAYGADLSEASIEEMLVSVVAKFVDSRGKLIKVMPEKLVVSPSNMFEATRILKNSDRPETANRDINALYMMNSIPGGIIVNHYLTDPDAWFITTNIPNGLVYMDRIPIEFSEDNDFDTTNLKFKARMRGAFGWADPRGIVGSAGAGA
jgi:hypothetical protein